MHQLTFPTSLRAWRARKQANSATPLCASVGPTRVLAYRAARQPRQYQEKPRGHDGQFGSPISSMSPHPFHTWSSVRRWLQEEHGENARARSEKDARTHEEQLDFALIAHAGAKTLCDPS